MEINNPLVSIIVPIYNVEKYLRKCVYSIINQTLTNIEIILVNDGSTDNCGKIIDEYAKNDKRIVVIHKENEGQSSARNKGLDIARGKYVGFVDSDDSIHKDMYENLYKSIEYSNADISVCGREAYSEDGKSYYKKELDDELLDFSKQSKVNYVINRLFYKHTVSGCNKIYKNEIIQNNKIRFEDIKYVGSEDALFNYKILLHTNKIKSIDKIGYIQLSRNGSTATTYKYGYMNRTANMIKSMHDYSVKTGKEDIYKNIAPMFLLFFYQWNISNIKSVKEQNIETLILNEIEDASFNYIFMKCVKQLGFNMKLNQNMKNMGFRTKGIVLIRTIMSLYYLKLNKLTTKVILLR